MKQIEIKANIDALNPEIDVFVYGGSYSEAIIIHHDCLTIHDSEGGSVVIYPRDNEKLRKMLEFAHMNMMCRPLTEEEEMLVAEEDIDV